MHLLMTLPHAVSVIRELRSGSIFIRHALNGWLSIRSMYMYMQYDFEAEKLSNFVRPHHERHARNSVKENRSLHPS